MNQHVPTHTHTNPSACTHTAALTYMHIPYTPGPPHERDTLHIKPATLHTPPSNQSEMDVRHERQDAHSGHETHHDHQYATTRHETHHDRQGLITKYTTYNDRQDAHSGHNSAPTHNQPVSAPASPYDHAVTHNAMKHLRTYGGLNIQQFSASTTHALGTTSIAYVRAQTRTSLLHKALAYARMHTSTEPRYQRLPFLCIDLKSFYASVECVDRDLDPLHAKLVVADATRGAHTLCLAVSPALKALGVKNRCRVHDIPSTLNYIKAMPRMRRYLQVSSRIVDIYSIFVSPEDIHVYSIDECFIYIQPYLDLYNIDAFGFAWALLYAVAHETHIPATVGIGANMFLAKLALDIFAKKSPNGIACLDEESFRTKLWFHRPLSDIWGIGKGTQRRLHRLGINDLASICAAPTSLLYKECGSNAEWLIDHAWGLEPCTIQQARHYRPQRHSLSNSQMLMRDYAADEGRTIVKEMVLESVLRLIAHQSCCRCVHIHIGYAHACARMHKRTSRSASKRLCAHTQSYQELSCACLKLYDQIIAPDDMLRKISISFSEVTQCSTHAAQLFTSPSKKEQIAQCTTHITSRFGKSAVFVGTSLLPEATSLSRHQQIGGHRA